MRRSDFEYSLPDELIAQAPLAQRSASRLLVVDGLGQSNGNADDSDTVLADHQFSDLPSLLRPGDLLVFNDTKVLPARVAARRASGGRVEVFLERPLPERRALVQMRASNPLREAEQLTAAATADPAESAAALVTLVRRHGDLWEIELPEPAVEFFEKYGEVPLPPYIRRAPDAADRERYQSVFARRPGAVAAPTASLHFDAELMRALHKRGVGQALVTLHVGAGTFQPVRADDLNDHQMHAEWYAVPEATVAAVAKARDEGGRVIAVGTTVARALESAAHAQEPGLRSAVGETTLFIRPGFQFRVADGLITNFHLPGSTLLMLIAAFAGFDSARHAYRHAVAQRYRFFSYGDAMLAWPTPTARSPMAARPSLAARQVSA